jgi:pyridoxine 4-dehydrogenase
MTVESSIQLAGVLVPRLGYGTMRLTGRGVVGPPANVPEARRVLRRALDLGIRVFDTAWYYGPDVPNQLLAEAVASHPADTVIATKLGWEWSPDGRLVAAHTPERLRAGLERDLHAFGSDAIAIAHLRWHEDRSVDRSFRTAVAAMIEMRAEATFRHLGLSNVGLQQLQYTLTQSDVASVSNSFSVGDQRDSELVDFTAQRGIAYLAWLPLYVSGSSQARTLGAWGAELGASPTQIALAWLVQRAPNIVPIPGTSSVDHLEENAGALSVVLPERAMREVRAA